MLKAVYAGWHNIPVKDYLAEKLGITHIVCENDVNSCAVGELKFGLGKLYKSFGWMTVSTGVGGAVVVDGQLIRGSHGFAGEFGHLKVEYENPCKCPCGDLGCLEAQGSGTALNRLIAENFPENISAADCAKLARKGDATAVKIFENVGKYLGRSIAYYVNILDPEAVIIGGGVSASLDLLMPSIRQSIEQYAFAPMRDVKILETGLGYEAALMGAIAIAT